MHGLSACSPQTPAAAAHPPHLPLLTPLSSCLSLVIEFAPPIISLSSADQDLRYRWATATAAEVPARCRLLRPQHRCRLRPRVSACVRQSYRLPVRAALSCHRRCCCCYRLHLSLSCLHPFYSVRLPSSTPFHAVHHFPILLLISLCLRVSSTRLLLACQVNCSSVRSSLPQAHSIPQTMLCVAKVPLFAPRAPLLRHCSQNRCCTWRLLHQCASHAEGRQGLVAAAATAPLGWTGLCSSIYSHESFAAVAALSAALLLLNGATLCQALVPAAAELMSARISSRVDATDLLLLPDRT